MDLLGKFDSLYIKDGVVTTIKLADTSVTAAKLNRMGATTGQVLKWNGTAWQAQNDSVKLYFPGQGIANIVFRGRYTVKLRVQSHGHREATGIVCGVGQFGA